VKPVAFAIPGDLATNTGGYAYDRQVMARLPAHGIAVSHVALPGGFPFPSEAEIAETGRLLMARGWNEVLLIDGLAYGAFPVGPAAGLAGRVVALVHHPLGLETGHPADIAEQLVANERAVLAYAAAVIVTGEATKTLLIDRFGVPPDRITVAEPGVDRASRAVPSPPGAPVRLLAVGSLVPRKGYEVLIDALAPLKGGNWSLTIIGEERAPGLQVDLQHRIDMAGLSSHITLAGGLPPEALDAAYAATDLFVMSSHYEGYGMVLTEALAHGLPIVTTACGPGTTALPPEAVRIVPVGDASALGAALAGWIEDHGARLAAADAAWAGAAWAGAATLPCWDDTARIVAGVLHGVTP
jgi:glycosyltransferase involved in cell wall biosynthesis